MIRGIFNRQQVTPARVRFVLVVAGFNQFCDKRAAVCHTVENSIGAGKKS